MKKILLVLIILIGGFSVSAQTPLTANINPTPGFFDFYRFADTLGITPGPAGNQVWSFTFDSSGLTNALPYITATGTPYDATFPGANLALNVPDGYYYYIQNADSFAMLGTQSPSALTYYSDPKVLRDYPLNYNEIQMDTFVGVRITTDTTIILGLFTTHYDGYGTLIVNGDSVENVVRVVTTEDVVAGSSLQQITTYTWMNTNSAAVLLAIELRSTIGAAPVKTVRVANSLFMGLAGIAASQTSFVLAPSVVRSADCSILLESASAFDGTVETVNTVGQIVSLLNVSAVTGLNRFDLPTADLKPGVYFVRVKAAFGGVTAARKLVVH